MTLTLADRRAISRQLSAGIGQLAVAQEFGIRVRDVQRVDIIERRKATKPRKAEPLPGLKERDWKQARPAEDRIRRGEACRSPGCEGTVERGSYCAEHGRLIYQSRIAA